MKHLLIIVSSILVSLATTAHAQSYWPDGLTMGLVAEGSRQYANRNGALDPQRELVPADPFIGRSVLKFDYGRYWDNQYLELRSRPYYEKGQESDESSKQLTERFTLGYQVSDFTLEGGVTSLIEGSGYSWNPSNPFTDIRHNEKDSASEFLREGDPYSSVTYEGDVKSVRAMWLDYKTVDQENRLDSGRYNSYALSMKWLFDESELMLTGASVSDEPFVGGSLSSTFGDQLELHGEASLVSRKQSARLVTSSINMPNQTLIIHDFSYDQEKGHDGRLLLGGQYTFTDNTNVIVEYLYNGSGLDTNEWKTFKAAVDYSYANINDPILSDAHRGFLQNTHNLLGLFRQNYLFLRAAFVEDGEDDTLSIISRLNLDDSSYLAGINKVWNVNEQFVLTATANYFHGDTYSEYGWIPYETSIKASVEYFFN